MDERKIRILYSIIQDFICTGEPVGSRTLSRKYNLGISSATIRNEMSDLEELGFLEQIHTSSGRKPSTKGYRLYVDKLMKPILGSESSEEFEKFIKVDLLKSDLYDIESVLKSKLDFISRITNLTCVLKIQSVTKSSIKSIQIIKVDEINVLAVTVTNEGIIKNIIIKLKGYVSENDIYLSNKIINDKLVGLTVEEINFQVINDLRFDLKLYTYIFDQIIPVLYEALTCNTDGECYLKGTTNILNYHEFNDIEKAKGFFYLLSNEVKFKSLLNSSRDIEVRIGEENFIKEAQNYSVILGNYKKRNKVLGTIGFIGPTRMDYPKVISILTALINVINVTVESGE